MKEHDNNAARGAYAAAAPPATPIPHNGTQTYYYYYYYYGYIFKSTLESCVHSLELNFTARRRRRRRSHRHPGPRRSGTVTELIFRERTLARRVLLCVPWKVN